MRFSRKDYQDNIFDQRLEDEGGIPADEPVFLLRARDKCAPNTIISWAERVSRDGGSQEIYDGAIQQANLMLDWQKANGSKTPDLPEASDD